MKKIIFSVALSLLCCSTFSYANTITKGNGIILDDVAYDMYCGSGGGQCNNLLTRLANYSQANFHYLMPDFGYIASLPSSTQVDTQTVCSTKKTLANITYFAEPQIKPAVFAANIGNCQSGNVITKYYADNGRYAVIPMFTSASTEIKGKQVSILEAASATQLKALANSIAQIINNDPNAAGVAFDIEPKFSQSSTTIDFFGTLAKSLAAKQKLLFIFDADRQTMAPIAEQYNNVVILVALYDFGAFPGFSANQAIPLNDYVYKGKQQKGYQSIANQYAKAYFGDGSQPEMKTPVMFVLPASATSTVWSQIQLYNVGLGSPYNSKGPASPYSSGATAASCFNNPISFLNKLLCQPVNPSNPYPACNPAANIAQTFVGSTNCVQYSNPNKNSDGSSVKFDDYFTAVLKSVDAVKQQPNYIGSMLYTSRAASDSDEAYNDINCAKDYYSAYYGTTSMLKRCLGVFPSNISDSVLTLFADDNEK